MTSPEKTRRFRIPGWLSIALRVAIVAGLLFWISTRINLRELWHTIAAADPRFLAAAAVAVVASQITAAYRWYRLLIAAGSTWSFSRSFAVYCGGLFLGLFIPTGVGGDVYRVARVRTSGTGLGRGSATILLERAIGLLALLLLGTGFVVAHPATRPWTPLFVIGSVVGLAGLAALWLPGGPDWLARTLDRFPGRGLGDRVRRAFPHEAMERLRGAIPGTLLLSILNHSWLLFANVLLARGLSLPVSWKAVCAAVPLVLLAAQIPISPGGFGVREAGYVYFLGRVGVEETPALALALGWFALLLAVGLLAAIGLLFDRDRDHDRAAAALAGDG
ncbi:MAG: lysylphosphatidylglycerol synthase transmembrane domain-containing protein [Candidatus Eiseniibacteriota bacterium]